jgi:hypothetical protein
MHSWIIARYAHPHSHGDPRSVLYGTPQIPALPGTNHPLQSTCPKTQISPHPIDNLLVFLLTGSRASIRRFPPLHLKSPKRVGHKIGHNLRRPKNQSFLTS